MLPPNHPDRIQVAFDECRLVSHPGLILPVTLAEHLGPPQLVERRPRPSRRSISSSSNSDRPLRTGHGAA